MDLQQIIKSNMDVAVPSVISTFAGSYSYDVLSNFMLTGNEGVKYYAEAHLSPWNSWIHTIIMPYSMYGMLFWLPALFNLNPKNARKMMWCLYALFGGHYLRISKMGAMLYYLMYFYTVKMATREYKVIYDTVDVSIDKNKKCSSKQTQLLTKGIKTSVYGLVFQELFGHWLGGDIPSRPEAVPNAIVYAMYFSAAHILGY